MEEGRKVERGTPSIHVEDEFHGLAHFLPNKFPGWLMRRPAGAARQGGRQAGRQAAERSHTLLQCRHYLVECTGLCYRCDPKLRDCYLKGVITFWEPFLEYRCACGLIILFMILWFVQ